MEIRKGMCIYLKNLFCKVIKKKIPSKLHVFFELYSFLKTI